jgi:hypothetical protein
MGIGCGCGGETCTCGCGPHACGIVYYSANPGSDPPGPIFKDCATFGCTDCAQPGGIPTKASGVVSGIRSDPSCTENDGDQLNRTFPLVPNGDCGWKSNEISLTICGSSRFVTLYLAESLTTATLTLDMGTLGTATFSKSITLPGICKTELTGTYTYNEDYSGTALDFSGSPTIELTTGCGLEPYWTLKEGSVLKGASGDAIWFEPGGPGDEDLIVNTTNKPQKTSCRWQWYGVKPQHAGDEAMIIFGRQDDDNYYYFSFIADEMAPTIEIHQVSGGEDTLLRKKVNVDSTFTFASGPPDPSGYTMRVSLCRKTLLCQVEGLTRDESGIRPDHDTFSYTYRPLIASLGGGGPGSDIILDNTARGWGIGAKTENGFPAGDILVVDTDPKSEDEDCWPDFICNGLLTEYPLTAEAEFRGVLNTDEPEVNGHCDDCESVNGTYSNFWVPGDGSLCVWEDSEDNLTCFGVGDGPPGTPSVTTTAVELNGAVIHTRIAAGIGGIGSDQEIPIPPSLFLLSGQAFWKPDDIDTTTWHDSTIAGEEGACDSTMAQSRFVSFTYEDDDI